MTNILAVAGMLGVVLLPAVIYFGAGLLSSFGDPVKKAEREHERTRRFNAGRRN